MDNVYKTSTIDFAAFLLAKDVSFLGVTTDRPRHIVFLFRDKLQCEQLHVDFLNNSPVGARDLLIRKRELLDKIASKLEESK